MSTARLPAPVAALSRAFVDPLLRSLLALLLLATALLALPAHAQDDPPGRVGRLADLQGNVSWFDHESGAWAPAERNRPLTGGDRLSTGQQGRAELRVGSTVLRLAAGTEMEVLRLDDEQMLFQLHSGSLALRVRTREAAAEIEIDTAEARFRPDRAGHYRFDRIDDRTQAGVLRGTLRIADEAGFVLEGGQRAELWRERGGLRFGWTRLPQDEFADLLNRTDQQDERTATNRYVSPEMTGAEDLDRDGRWERHPEYGAIWYPVDVQAGWAPYRYGRWVWVRPWGWTWVDNARWGFAPFHYGRWVSYGGRWGWCPGDYVVRPVYSPALVAWIGGSNFSVGINIGGPNVGWVPLAPRDWYVPHYRHSPVYYDRVNRVPPNYPGWQRAPQRPGPGTVVWGNQAVPGAVTVVPRDVLLERKPVWRGAVDTRDWHREGGRAPMPWVAPPGLERRDGREARPGWDGREGRDGRDRRDGRDSSNEQPPQRIGPPPPGFVRPETSQQQPQPQVQPLPQPVPSVRDRFPPREREQDRDRGDRAWDRSPDRGQDRDRGFDRDRSQPGRNPGFGAPPTGPAVPVTPPPATIGPPPVGAPQQRPAPAPPQVMPPRPPVMSPGPPPAAPPVAPPAAVGPPPFRAPQSAPDRAREREAAERDQAERGAKAQEERKRGPEAGARGPSRERGERDK